MLDGNEQNDLGNADDFVNSINGDAETAPTVDAPEKIGEFESESYFNAMSGLTEGKVSSYEQFQESLTYRSKHDELQSKYNELEAKSQMNPFANDLSKEINRLFKDNATESEVLSFIKLQQMNTTEMSEEDAIKLHQKMSMGGALSEEDIQDWYNETYGSDDDELTGMQKVKKFEAAKAAKEGLGKMKVDSGEPDSVKKNRQIQAKYESDSKWWGNVVNKTITNKEKYNVSVPVGKDGDKDITLDFDFPVPQEVRDVMQIEATKYAAYNQLRNNDADYSKVQEFCNRVMWANCGAAIVEAAVRNAKSTTTEEVTKSHHNVKTLGQGDNSKPLTSAEKTKAQERRAHFRKAGPF